MEAARRVCGAPQRVCALCNKSGNPHSLQYSMFVYVVPVCAPKPIQVLFGASVCVRETLVGYQLAAICRLDVSASITPHAVPSRSRPFCRPSGFTTHIVVTLTKRTQGPTSREPRNAGWNRKSPRERCCDRRTIAGADVCAGRHRGERQPQHQKWRDCTVECVLATVT